ncbi:GldG family protein [Paenibacillus sp. tmac-D7]|uniref:GldG family protein n=1 Tax=Paenibacillus sp. tmac-D7 TaxID=2591462 RepID=UPI001143DDF5|nr:GldG family protein [Paenibacillus sp. tmac-D7]
MNKWIRGTNATVLSLAVIGIFIVLTIFLNSAKNMQVDLTQNNKFTLSDQTKQTLSALDKDIRILSFTTTETNPYMKREVVELVEEYKKRSGRITFEEYDAVANPAVAKQYEVDPAGTLVVQSGEQKKTLPFYDMFLPSQQNPNGYSFSGEEKLTQALVNFNVKEKRKLYFLSGHNEIPLTQMTLWRSGLESANYEVKELNLLREGKIPDDAEMLVIVGPETDLSDKEAELVKAYMDGKGKLYLALGFNPDMSSKWKNIDALMSAYGIKDQHAVAIEPKQSTMYDPLSIVPEYSGHEITRKLQEYNLLTVMTLAVTLKVDQPNADYPATAILSTTDKAYGETDLKALAGQGTSKKDAADVAGPLELGYVVENKEKKPKAVVLGGSTFLVDRYIQQQGNRDFALNSVGWLQEQKDQVTIRPREGDNLSTALVTGEQANMIFLGTVVVFPLLFLLIGGFIWWRRRKG